MYTFFSFTKLVEVISTDTDTWFCAHIVKYFSCGTCTWIVQYTSAQFKVEKGMAAADNIKTLN